MAKFSCSVEFARGFLLLFNIVFLLVGFALLGLGIYVKVDDKFSAVLGKLANVSTFEAQSLGFLAFVLIGGGILSIIIALIGCIGTLKLSRCLLISYAIILCVIMLLELIGFFMAFAYKGKLEKVYKEGLTKVFTDAVLFNQTKVLNAFHELEKSVKCCGVNGIADYTKYGVDAPSSCYQYMEGCSTVIINALEKNLPAIGGTLGGVLLLEILGLISAIMLAIALKNSLEENYSSNPSEVIAYVVPGRRRNYSKF